MRPHITLDDDLVDQRVGGARRASPAWRRGERSGRSAGLGPAGRLVRRLGQAEGGVDLRLVRDFQWA